MTHLYLGCVSHSIQFLLIVTHCLLLPPTSHLLQVCKVLIFQNQNFCFSLFSFFLSVLNTCGGDLKQLVITFVLSSDISFLCLFICLLAVTSTYTINSFMWWPRLTINWTSYLSECGQTHSNLLPGAWTCKEPAGGHGPEACSTT